MKILNKQILNTLLIISTIRAVGVVAEVEMLDDNTSKQQIRDALYNRQSHSNNESMEERKTRGFKKRSIEGFSSKEQNLKTHVKIESTQTSSQRYDAGLATAIHFKFDSTELLPGSRIFINKVGDVLAEKEAKFIIEGHTDATGSEKHNIKLSEERAERIKQIFTTEHNIASERISTEGKGETSLRFSPYNSKNRRVEIKLLN